MRGDFPLLRGYRRPAAFITPRALSLLFLQMQKFGQKLLGLYRKQPARAALKLGLGLGPSRTVCAASPGKRESADWNISEMQVPRFGFAFVAHGYLEPSRRVPGERERYLTSRLMEFFILYLIEMVGGIYLDITKIKLRLF